MGRRNSSAENAGELRACSPDQCCVSPHLSRLGGWWLLILFAVKDSYDDCSIDKSSLGSSRFPVEC